MKERVPRLASGRLGRTERQGEEPPCGAGRRTPLWGAAPPPGGAFRQSGHADPVVAERPTGWTPDAGSCPGAAVRRTAACIPG